MKKNAVSEPNNSTLTLPLPFHKITTNIYIQQQHRVVYVCMSKERQFIISFQHFEPIRKKNGLTVNFYFISLSTYLLFSSLCFTYSLPSSKKTILHIKFNMNNMTYLYPLNPL